MSINSDIPCNALLSNRQGNRQQVKGNTMPTILAILYNAACSFLAVVAVALGLWIVLK